MRIFTVSLGYIYNQDKEKKDKELLRRDLLLQECGIKVEPKDPDDPYSGINEELLVTGEQVLAMLSRKIDFRITKEANIEREPEAMMDNITKALAKIDDFFSKSANNIDQYNAKVNVHMPGQALSTYNQTMLLQDSCTDNLQYELDKGWRIIACCPQPDQRRPDYILGRFNPTHDVGFRAARTDFVSQEGTDNG